MRFSEIVIQILELPFFRFIEKLKIEIGREVKEYRGQLEEVYEEMIIKDMTNIQDKKKKLTVDLWTL